MSDKFRIILKEGDKYVIQYYIGFGIWDDFNQMWCGKLLYEKDNTYTAPHIYEYYETLKVAKDVLTPILSKLKDIREHEREQKRKKKIPNKI